MTTFDDVKQQFEQAAEAGKLYELMLDSIDDVAGLGVVDIEKLAVLANGLGVLKKNIAQWKKLVSATRRSRKSSAGKAQNEYEQANGYTFEIRKTEDENGNETETRCMLSNFTALIDADILEDDGENTKRQLEISGELYTGEQLPTVRIDAGDFEDMRWVNACWGGRPAIVPDRAAKNNLRYAMQILSAGTIEQRMTYTHSGFRVIDGKRVYLYHGGAIGADDVDAKLPDRLSMMEFPKDDAVDAKTAMIESLKLLGVAKPHVSYPLLAVTYLAPLTEILSPTFVPWIEGGSGAFKTSYGAIFQNHFAPKASESTMLSDWMGTAGSLEKLAFHAKDALLIIDDFRPSNDTRERLEMDSKADRIIRAVGNRHGRSRLTAGSELKKTFAPRGVVMATAERGARGKSTQSRVMKIAIEPGDVDPIKLSEAQSKRHIYSYAMRSYIEAIIRDWEHLSVELPVEVTEIRNDQTASGYHKRLPTALATLYVAFSCAMAHAVELGALTEDEAKAHEYKCMGILENISASQAEDVEQENPTEIFMRSFVSLLHSGTIRVASKSDPTDGYGSPDGLRVGWHDADTIYLLPSAYMQVVEMIRKSGGSFTSDEKTLRAEFQRDGWISANDNGKLTAQVRDPCDKGAKVYATKLNRKKFNSWVETTGMHLPIYKLQVNPMDSI